jgi:hypothetical protein
MGTLEQHLPFHTPLEKKRDLLDETGGYLGITLRVKFSVYSASLIDT